MRRYFSDLPARVPKAGNKPSVNAVPIRFDQETFDALLAVERHFNDAKPNDRVNRAEAVRWCVRETAARLAGEERPDQREETQ